MFRGIYENCAKYTLVSVYFSRSKSATTNHVQFINFNELGDKKFKISQDHNDTRKMKFRDVIGSRVGKSNIFFV